MPQLSQAQAVARNSLTREGYEYYRVTNRLAGVMTSAGKPYVYGLKIMGNIGKGHIPFTEREVRRRKALNLEMDALGMTDAEFGSIRNSPDKVEAWVIQKKTRNYTVNFQLKCKQKSQRELIQLLRH
tara:strand:- start:78 stop:458 length:381 start_codon:yes stop_codon:yes gene_type:complete